jgi:small subunit ribosomal protein S13
MRLAGVNIKENQATFVALTKIYGIGVPTARKICKDIGVTPDAKLSELGEDKVEKIRDIVGGMVVEGELRNAVYTNIRNEEALRSYKGIRHNRGLPVRGQRTQTNAKTARKKLRT